MERYPAKPNATSAGAEHLADLLTLSYEPMFAWRLDGSIELWNAGAERLYGFASNEAVGHSSHALLQTKFPVQFTELRSKLRSERYWSGELRHICKHGREVTVDSRMQLLGDDTVLEVNRDVTEINALLLQQAKLMQDLSAAAAKFEAIFNQTGIFAGIMDLQGYLREANNLSLDWCGYTREQVLDRPFWDTPWCPPPCRATKNSRRWRDAPIDKKCNLDRRIVIVCCPDLERVRSVIVRGSTAPPAQVYR